MTNLETSARSSPEVSVVIPIHNEERILTTAVDYLMIEFGRRAVAYELILCENGSTDRTPAILAQLAQERTEVHALHHQRPDYGASLRSGLECARGRFVVCDEIDLCDFSFHDRALEDLRSGRADLVVGSKRHPESRDGRPLQRRFGTLAFNLLLRALLGFRGTDTHGLKAFHRERLRPVLESCKLGGNLFTSEFVLRSERSGCRIVEIPVAIEERRTTPISLVRRTPGALMQVAHLFWALRVRRSP